MGAASKFQEKGLKAMQRMPVSVARPIVKAVNFARKKYAFSLKTPINLTLYVTNRCNANCRHCFYKSELNIKREELSLEQIRKIAKSLRYRLQTLMISGGEPFLRDDIVEICRIFLQENKTRRITIDTNGMLINKIISNVKEILALNPETLHIQISLDGPEGMHDRMRGIKGCYEKAVSTLNQLEAIRDKRLQLSIMTTICKINSSVLPAFAEQMAKEHPAVLHKFNIVRGARTGTFALPADITSGLDTEEEQMDVEDMEALFNKIEKSVSKNMDEIWQKAQKLKWERCIELLKTKKKICECLAGYTLGVIYSNGDVTLCEPAKPFANLKDFDYNFYKLWNSEKANEMRKKTRSCYCIHPCNLLDSMAYDSKTIMRLIKHDEKR